MKIIVLLIGLILIGLFLLGCTNVENGKTTDKNIPLTDENIPTNDLPIIVLWKNNPLDLTSSTQYAELNLTFMNTSKDTTDLTLNVTSESSEIIIFCPDSQFLNVSSQNQRQTTCLVRQNPNVKTSSGTYFINIKTNLGNAQTVLNIITK